MRKALLLLIVIFLFQSCVWAKKEVIDDEIKLPNIFIYSIPDSETQNEPEHHNNEIINASTLKGYAEFVEDSSVVYLKDDTDDFVLNLKKPQKILATKGLNLNGSPEKNTINKYKDAEYVIAPTSIKTSTSYKDFTFGTLYGNEIDNIAMLEAETGLFTKYQKNKFALSSSYKKNVNTLYSQNYDTVSVTPELQFNNYVSLKNTYSADITRNRRSGSIVFSFNPYGKKDKDRIKFELGAKQTYYLDTDKTKTEFSFLTRFKL